MKRPRQHGMASTIRRHHRWPLYQWVAKLRAAGKQHEIVILDSCHTKAALDDSERFHIAYFRAIGMKLLNCTDGGEGTPGLPASAERKSKISAANKGKDRTEEALRNMSMAHLGKKLSPESIAKRSAAVIGTKRSPETRARMSAAQTGKTHSAEARARIGAASKGRTHSAETRAKMSAAHLRRSAR